MAGLASFCSKISRRATGLGVMLTLWTTGFAAVIHVDQNRPGGGGGDGTSWADAFKTVTGALDVAGAGDEIWIARGTYLERITLKAGVKLYGGFDATETLLSARDWTANRSILDGEAAGTVVSVEPGADDETRIDGLVIRNGRGGLGGGVQVIDGSPVIANNWIVRNVATNTGGGIYLATSAALVISNRIAGNWLTNYQDFVLAGGGGIVSSNGSPQIRGNQIVDNHAQYGGGIRVWEGTAQITGNTVVGNRVMSLGAGVEVARASVVIERNRIAGNVVLDGPGGGLSVVGPGEATVRGNLVLANHARYNDGGLFASTDESSRLFLINNTFLANRGYTDHALTIYGTNFEAVNNLVAFGGSVRVFAAENWRNNCVFGNDGTNYEGGIVDPTGTNGNISVDPLLGWSRERAEYHLQPGSPCIDAGTMAGISPGDLDLDGEARVLGGMVDIGADELGSEPMSFIPRIVRVSVSGDDANDGLSWANAKRTIQSALDHAVGESSEVWVAAGHYDGQIHLRPVVKLFGGFAGSESTRNERNPKLHPTVLDGGGVTNVVRGEYLDQVVELNGFVIQNGRAVQGGGIKLLRAPISIVNNRIQANGTFQGNAGFNAGPPDAGGALFVQESDARLEGNVIQSNFALIGGAAYVRSGRSLFQRNLIMANVSTNLGFHGELAAGLVLNSSGTVVANNQFIGNKVHVQSGLSIVAGTAIWAAKPAKIVNNTFFGNLGVYRDNGSFGPGTIPQQAAINLEADGSEIANNIFTMNTVAIRTSSFQNQLIRHNCFFQQLGPDVVGLPVPTAEAGNIFADPRLVGPYANLHLSESSPCRNAGDNTYVDPAWLDFDGEPRVAEGVVDIGADEFSGLVPETEIRRVYVRADGSDMASGSSWAEAKQTIQHGIDAAFSLGGAEVWVARGSYAGIVEVKPFTYLHGGFAGNEQSLDERNLLANQTVIDAQKLGTVVTMDAPGTYSALTGFTIINGLGFFGGGVYCRPLSAPLIANNRIFNCATDNRITSVSSSQAARYSGGGGIRGESASPVILNNVIVSNSAPALVVFGRLHAGGGGISLSGGSQAVVANNTLARNSGYAQLGSISLRGANVEIRNNIIAFGTGGISAATGTNPLIERNCFFGNADNGLTGDQSVFDDPRFLDDQAMFFLAADSPCLDTGLSLAGQTGWTDVYGRARVAGLAPDIGAVEMQTGDTVLPFTQVPSFTVEVVGGVAYLKYERTVNGDESGELLPQPSWAGTNLFWSFAVTTDLAGGAAPESFLGTIPLGALPPGGYRLNPVSWGVPLAVTDFTVPADSGGTIASPLLSAARFEFLLNGVDHVRYVTEQSVDWGPWEAVATNDTATGVVLIPTDRLTGRDYFRVRIEPREVPVP
jgi:hypothetical protein